MRSLIPCLACLLISSVAAAQSPSFAVSAGYSNFDSNAAAHVLHTRDGGYVDADFSWYLRDLPVPLLIGGGISGSAYYRTRDVFIPFDTNLFEDVTLESDVGLLSFEGRVAVPVGLNRGRGFFVMPKVGAGLLIDDYTIDFSTRSGGTTFLGTTDHSGAAFEVRPGVDVGYSWGWGAAGAQFSYMAAWGDFGQLGNAAQEFRAGVFFRFSF